MCVCVRKQNKTSGNKRWIFPFKTNIHEIICVFCFAFSTVDIHMIMNLAMTVNYIKNIKHQVFCIV